MLGLIGLMALTMRLRCTADMAISVNNSTVVAEVAADIILTKKGLLAPRYGIIEVRRSFSITMKDILMGHSNSFGNLFSVAATTLFLPR